MGDESAVSGRARIRAGAGLVALVLAVPIVSTAHVLPVEVPFSSSIAWLTNTSRGEVVQVNGQTGQVEATLDLDTAQDISIAQSDGVAVVQIDGEIRSIDLASLEWGETISAEGQLVTGAGDEPAVYLVRPDGVVLSLDPLTLQTTGEVTLAGRPGTGVVAEGRLFVPVGTAEDTLIQVIDGDQMLGSVGVGADEARVRVSRVGDQVAVLNLTEGTLTAINPARSEPTARSVTELDLPPGELLVPAELPDGFLWLVAVRQGDLLAVDLSSGETHGAVHVASERSDLAGPVVLEDRVFVLNRDTGMVIQVDADTLTEITPRQRLDQLGLQDASRAEILAEGGKIFINDPASDAAVVFSSDGTAVQIDKYDEDGPAVPMPPSEFATDRASDGEPASDETTDETPDEPAPPPPPPTDPPPTIELPEIPEAPEIPEVPEIPEIPAPAPTSTTAPPPPTAETTTSTTPPSTTLPPAPVPPGAIALSHAPGDGQIALSWTEATSASPVTYHIASERPIGGATSWTTSDLSRTFTGLSNGESYRFTVTPANDGGNGPSSSTNAVPVGQPSVASTTTTPSGRDFNITFTYNLNGSELQSCTVIEAGGTRTPANCSTGNGTATVTVPNYNSTHSFTVEVITSTGTATATTPAATTETKPLTVDGSYERWGGSCYYMNGHGTNRPVLAAPIQTCQPGGPGPDHYDRMAAHGSTQRVLCYRNDAVLRDDPGNRSGVWLQLDDGWMNALYFTNWGSAADNLAQC